MRVRLRAERVHGSLRRTAHFLGLFCDYANAIAPEIERLYRVDVHTAYANLRWSDAFVSTRNQDIAVGALLANVNFSVRSVAPEPVIVIRRWDQLAALEEELRLLNVKALDDFKTSGAASEEWHPVTFLPSCKRLVMISPGPLRGV